MLRTLKLQIQMSVDGFVAGPNGEMDWMTWEWSDDIKDFVDNITHSVDTIILGRKLAEGFIPHWKNVAEDENNPEQKAGIFFTNTPKVVFSKTLNPPGWDHTILAKGNLREEIETLKNQKGKDIIVYGGASFVSNLIVENLIDELYLFVNPVAIGSGMPIFNQLKVEQQYQLIKSIAFVCGINALVYKRI